MDASERPQKPHDKTFLPPEPPKPFEPREDVRAAVSPVRCPYCHTDVSPELRDWVACRGCLARHHAGCWKESGSCASCRGTEPLVGLGESARATPAAVPERAAPSSSRRLAAAVVGGLVACALGFAVLPLAKPVAVPSSSTAAPPRVAPREDPRAPVVPAVASVPRVAWKVGARARVQFPQAPFAGDSDAAMRTQVREAIVRRLERRKLARPELKYEVAVEPGGSIDVLANQELSAERLRRLLVPRGELKVYLVSEGQGGVALPRNDGRLSGTVRIDGDPVLTSHDVQSVIDEDSWAPLPSTSTDVVSIGGERAAGDTRRAVVRAVFTDAARGRMAELVKANAGRRVAAVLDGAVLATEDIAAISPEMLCFGQRGWSLTYMADLELRLALDPSYRYASHVTVEALADQETSGK